MTRSPMESQQREGVRSCGLVSRAVAQTYRCHNGLDIHIDGKLVAVALGDAVGVDPAAQTRYAEVIREALALYLETGKTPDEIADEPRGAPLDPEEWLPIETAPKDGTLIIVFRPVFDGDYIPQVGCDRWKNYRTHSSWAHSRGNTPPTMWQPMPAAPVAACERAS